MKQRGDEFYLGLLDELAELHVVKSGSYGTEEDALANFLAVSDFSRDADWWYPILRIVEKLARVDSLRAQGRVDEIGQELPDIASLALCSESLRRRYVVSAEPRLNSPKAPSPEAGLSSGEDTTLFAERLRGLAALVGVVGLARDLLTFEDDRRQEVERELVAALVDASDLIEPPTSVGGSYVAPCAQGSEATQVAHSAHTSCKSALFRSDAADAEVLGRRVEAADVEGYERRRTALAVADDESARLRDAQQGDDGRVRA